MFDGLFEPTHLLVIALVALIFFGPKRLPAIGRKVGEWLGEFRKATGGLGEELKAGLQEPTHYTAPEPAKMVEKPATMVETPAEAGPRPPAPTA